MELRRNSKPLTRHQDDAEHRHVNERRKKVKTHQMIKTRWHKVSNIEATTKRSASYSCLKLVAFTLIGISKGIFLIYFYLLLQSDVLKYIAIWYLFVKKFDTFTWKSFQRLTSFDCFKNILLLIWCIRIKSEQYSAIYETYSLLSVFL